MNAGTRSALFALLDDCDASDAAATSRLYTGFVREHICTDVAMLDAVCAAAEGEMREGLHAVVLGDYEFGRDLEFGFDGQIFEAAEGDLVAESAPDVERDAGVELLIDRRHHSML